MMFSGFGSPLAVVPTRFFDSTKVSSAVRSTADRGAVVEGGSSSVISLALTNLVRMRKSRMALVMLASS